MLKRKFIFILVAPIIAFIVLFIIYPYITIVINSFKSNSNGQFTFWNWKNLFTLPQYLDAVKNSLLFASTSTLVAAFFGTIIGWISLRFSEQTIGKLKAIFSIPMTLSGLVVAFSFIVLIGRSGIYNTIISLLGANFMRFNLYSWEGLLIVYCFYNIPLFSITMMSVFRNLDMSLVEASKNLGANMLQTWFYVIIPNLAPGFISAFSLVFGSMMGAFGTALALTGLSRMLLSLLIWSTASESNFNIPQADAMAILLAIIIYISLFFFLKLEKKLLGD